MKECKDCRYRQKMKDGKSVCQVCQMEDEMKFSDDYRICDDVKECKYFTDFFQFRLFVAEKRDYEYIYDNEYNFLDREKMTKAKKVYPQRKIYLKCKNSEEEFKEVCRLLKENKVEIAVCSNYDFLKGGPYLITGNNIMIEVEVSLFERQFATQAFGFSEKDRDFLCFDSKEEKFNGTWLEYVLSIK